MNVSARIRNGHRHNDASVACDGVTKSVAIPAKDSGYGSSLSGGELLLLALATCYGNDLYREAAKLGVELRGVEVDVECEFSGPGEPARNIVYRARVDSPDGQDRIRELLLQTDLMAEVHSTLRGRVTVTLEL